MFKRLLMISSFVILTGCGSDSGSNSGVDSTTDAPLPPAENVEIHASKVFMGGNFGQVNNFIHNSKLYQVMRDDDNFSLTRLAALGVDESFGTQGFQNLTGPSGILSDTKQPTSLIECKNNVYSVTNYNVIHQLKLEADGASFSAEEIDKLENYTSQAPQGVELYCTDSHLAVFHLKNGADTEWGIASINLTTKKLNSYKVNFSFNSPKGMWSHNGKVYFLTIHNQGYPQYTEMTFDEVQDTATLGTPVSVPSLKDLNLGIALQNRNGVNTLSGFTPQHSSLSVSTSLTSIEIHDKMIGDKFTPEDFHTFEFTAGNFISFRYNICHTLDNKQYGVFLNKGNSSGYYETSFFVLDTETKAISANFNEGKANILPQNSPYDSYWGDFLSNVGCLGNSIYFSYQDTLSTPEKAVMVRYSF